MLHLQGLVCAMKFPSHLDSLGNAAMVNIAHKADCLRMATASSRIHFPSTEIFQLAIKENNKKGDIFTVAKVAGILAAKNTCNIIPLCHQVRLSNIQLTIEKEDSSIIVQCTATATDKTGVEMEALVGASIASLTIYDMCKALSNEMKIHVELLEKKKGLE
jgi:cyclic pyranopterin phosphate synthase